MKYLLAVLLLIATQQAYTSEQDHTCQGGHNCNTENPDEPHTQDMEQRQEQLQTQSQTQFVDVSGGDGGRGGDATGGNVGDISINTRHQRSAPSVYAPAVYPTAPCIKGWSLGGSGLKFSGALGSGKPDEACERRELIRLAPETHKLFLFCNEPTVLAMFKNHEACLNYNKPSTPPTPKPTTYDDTVLIQQVEALTARTQTLEVKSNRPPPPHRPDPIAAMQARVLAQTEYYE